MTVGTGSLRTYLLWDRKSEGGFPEVKELKRRVRDVVDPGRDLGHVDRHGGGGKDDADDEPQRQRAVSPPAAEEARPELVSAHFAAAALGIPLPFGFRPPAGAVEEDLEKKGEKTGGGGGAGSSIAAELSGQPCKDC